MRRKDREVTDFLKITDIIGRCDVLRLGLADGDFPYIVPVNFAYEIYGEQLVFYIHGAKAGRKYELLSALKLCSFEMDIPEQTVISDSKNSVTMYYESVMGTASATFLEDEEKHRALSLIAKRYTKDPNFKYSAEAAERTAVIKLTVKSVSAKVNPA